MPTIYREGPYRFLFYSKEGAEPPHIHVERDDQMCKFWLEPLVSLAENDGFATHELNRIEQLVRANQAKFVDRYRQYHGR